MVKNDAVSIDPCTVDSLSYFFFMACPFCVCDNPFPRPFDATAVVFSSFSLFSIPCLPACLPQTLAFPSSITPAQLALAAPQRSRSRMPALVWLHPASKAPLCRSSQPMAGMTTKVSSAPPAAAAAPRHFRDSLTACATCCTCLLLLLCAGSGNSSRSSPDSKDIK